MNRTTRPRRLARQRPSVESLESRALLALAGSLNPTFGTHGSVFAPVVPANLVATANASNATFTAVEPDGSVVFAGSYTNAGQGYFTVAKLNPNGTPDTAFGQGGQVSFLIGPSSTTSNGASVPMATALVVQPNGTIDIGGTLAGATSTSNGTYGVIQVTPAGLIDGSFGSKGIAELPTTASVLSLKAMTLNAAGQLLVAGEFANSPSGGIEKALYVARFNTNGTDDPSFGSSGGTVLPISIDSTTIDQATALAVQPSGRILLTGYAVGSPTTAGQTTNFNVQKGLVIGLTPSGALDRSFGGAAQGELILPPDPANPSTLGNRTVVGVTLESNGPILLVGTNAIVPSGSTTAPNPTGQLTLLNADGTTDSVFGTAGIVNFTNNLTPNSATIQANGQIVVPGYVYSATGTPSYTAAVARYNANGSVDTSFGTPSSAPGLSTFSAGTAEGILTTAAINPKGQIILGGTIDTLNSAGTAYIPNFVALQLYPIIPVESFPTANFDGSGLTNLSVYLPSTGEFVYRATATGINSYIPFGIAGAGQTIPAPGSYDGSGKTEIAAYLPSVGIYAYRPANGGPDVLESFGIPGAGQSIPVPGDYFGTGVDDIAVYMPSLGAFGIRNPLGGPDEIIPFGSAGFGNSIPAPGDYFGTGQTDIAVYLPAIGAFAIRNPTTGVDSFFSFGIPGAGQSIPIPGDYDGSGRTELAVYLPTIGKFAYRPANGGPDVIEAFGSVLSGAIPVPGDYTGVGHDEIAIDDPTYATFAYRPANGGPDVIIPFGLPGAGNTLPIAAPTSSNVPVVQNPPFPSTQITSKTVTTKITKNVVKAASIRPAQAVLADSKV